MELLRAFLVGGMICVIGQLLLSLTELTPARILVGFVISGVILTALGFYEPLIEFGGAGASVPLTGFGYTLAKGVEKAVKNAVASKEVSVIIAQRPCALLDKSKKTAVAVKDCRACGICMRLGCPAISMGESGVKIDPIQCTGCGVCVQVCPFGCLNKA